jgi:hypothetical protein
VKGPPPGDADEWAKVTDKYEQHFSEKPGEGS